MTSAENIFTLSTIIFLGIIAVCSKNIPWKKLGLLPKPWWKGWALMLAFTLLVFVLVQSFAKFIHLPTWVTDKDPIVILLVEVLLQEIIFRALLLTWLERMGKQKALLASTLLFAAIHLALPDPWFLTGLSLIAGYFWGWHFLKFRNIYWLIISHLIVNLSFNYLFF